VSSSLHGVLGLIAVSVAGTGALHLVVWDATERFQAVDAGKNRVGGPEGRSFFYTLIVQ